MCLSRSPCIPTELLGQQPFLWNSWQREVKREKQDKPASLVSRPSPSPPQSPWKSHFQPHHYNWLLKTPRNIITMWILLPNNRSFSKAEEERNIDWAAEIHMLMMTHCLPFASSPLENNHILLELYWFFSNSWETNHCELAFPVHTLASRPASAAGGQAWKKSTETGGSACPGWTLLWPLCTRMITPWGWGWWHSAWWENYKYFLLSEIISCLTTRSPSKGLFLFHKTCTWT